MKKVILCIMIFGFVTSIIGCEELKQEMESAKKELEDIKNQVTAGGGSEPEQSEIDNYTAMGDVLKTSMFEWKVTSKQKRNSITSDGLTLLDPKEGQSYLVIYLEAKNVDSESRTFSDDGILWIRPTGKKKMIQYDNSETVFTDNFNLTMQTVNPFITAKRKVVFAVPDGLEGEHFYQPPRASSKERIKIS
jgi:hypothetical protein